MANMPLTDIGITPRKASQFASKGIETVTDLLGYYPTKYLDFRNPISFAEGKYHQGEHVAIKGKVDHLVGLKENVIIGKLIPAGAGLNAYREFAEEIVPEPEKPEEEPHEPRIITNAVEV